MSGPTAPELVAALEDAQRLGFLGARPIPEVIAHARGFVRALGDHQIHHGELHSVLDLGSGGGVPGLVIAHDRPDLQVTLLDRRAKRTDALERVARRLEWGDRVTVVCRDVGSFEPHEPFDAVVARGFGPPEFTVTTAARLVRPGGLVVISEPPGADRWDNSLLHRVGLRRLDGPSTPNSTPASSPDRARDIDGFVAVFVSQ